MDPSSQKIGSEFVMDFIEIFFSILSLIILELVLGIDNLVILSILTEKLPSNERQKARQWGLALAWVTRLMLLGAAFFMVHLIKPLFSIGDLTFSFRDLFLIAGGVFLVWKSTDEIHREMMKEKNIERASNQGQGKTIRFHSVIIQVALLDVIFSLDSVMTAVGITPHFWVMALAITGAIIVMIFASEPVSSFIMNNPTVKMLALSYLMLIAMVLVADGFSCPIPRGYIYFSMGCSLGVETLNLMRCARYKRDQLAKKG